MKITFGKRAFQEISMKRSITSGRNVKWINVENNKNLKKIVYWSVLICLLLFIVIESILFRSEISEIKVNYSIFFAVMVISSPLLLIIHELLHVLAAKILKLKNIILCFYHYGFQLNPFTMKPGACVIFDNVPMLFMQRLFFSLSPFFVLSLIPAISAIFLPNIRFFLIMFSIINASGCIFDLTREITLIIKKPKGKSFVSGNVFIIPQGDDSTIAHIYVNSEEKIIVREWKIAGKKLIETELDITGNVANCVSQIERERADGAWWVTKKPPTAVEI